MPCYLSTLARALHVGVLLSFPAAAETVKLVARDPVAVGHVQNAEGVVDGRLLELRTLALEPPLFHLPGLLTEAEADEIVALATSEGLGLARSIVNTPEADGAPKLIKKLKRGKEPLRKVLLQADGNRDGMLSREEMFRFVQTVLGVVDYDHEPVVRHVLGDDASAEASIPVENAVRAGLGRFLIDIVEKEPWRLTRYSEQLWLTYDKSPVLQKLLVRVQRITGLPELVVNQSEDLQVLRYGPHGHYSCHHDMSPDTIDEGKDAPRIATVAIFLNDVTRGGEIAFPAANRDDIAPSELEKYWMLEEQCQPRKACTRLGGVVFSPKKGDALLWYNIRPEFWNDLKRKETQRQGFGEQSLMWSSVHCGAEVIEGEKWMANMWIGLGPHGHEEL